MFDVRDPGEPRVTAIVGDLRDRSQVEAAVHGAFSVAELHPVPRRFPFMAERMEGTRRGA